MSKPRPDAPLCILCGSPMAYFGTWTDEQMDRFDPDRDSIMLRYLCFACQSLTEIYCGADDIDSRAETQEEKDSMVSGIVIEWLTNSVPTA